MGISASDRPWLPSYPDGVPETISLSGYSSLVALMEEAFERHQDLCAFTTMGARLSFANLDALSQKLGAYFQGLGLVRGDRVAIMMPNVLQYPVAVAAVLRAGFVVVNVNPLYTPRELSHQLNDSGCKAIVILENFAHTLAECMQKTPIKHVVLASMGDLLGWFKGAVVNRVVRKHKKLVPAFHLPEAVRFLEAIKRGAAGNLRRHTLELDDIAVLQYTGGTTGVSKGAVLLHRNLLANVLQSEAWNSPALRQVKVGEQITTVIALPMYHIFAFTVSMMLGMRMGSCGILIPNPRDVDAVLKELAKHQFHSFPAVNTLFSGVLKHPNFDRVDWSHLKVSVGGGMAVQGSVAQAWRDQTGCSICEGYGLSEASPSVSCNPITSTQHSGNIGLPLPATEMVCLDDAGQEVALGQPGEIAVKGPQVMAGYWMQAEETAKLMTADGFFRTGDIGCMDERGYFTIIDRKKDMILVSGFNVYPSEIEGVLANLPGVLECAAVGVSDDVSGEAIKLVLVRDSDALSEQQVRAHCKTQLTGYKQPKFIEFRTALPKTAVGKVWRKALREPP